MVLLCHCVLVWLSGRSRMRYFLTQQVICNIVSLEESILWRSPYVRAAMDPAHCLQKAEQPCKPQAGGKAVW